LDFATKSNAAIVTLKDLRLIVKGNTGTVIHNDFYSSWFRGRLDRMIEEIAQHFLSCFTVGLHGRQAIGNFRFSFNLPILRDRAH